MRSNYSQRKFVETSYAAEFFAVEDFLFPLQRNLIASFVQQGDQRRPYQFTRLKRATHSVWRSFLFI